ncbi:MAG: hypothetical protein R2712_15845 [Vicinamibacterales bacterium]
MATLPADLDWSTAALADACVSLGLDLRVGPPGLVPLVPGRRAAGRVQPSVHAGSMDVVLEAIQHASPGDVLLVDNNGRLDEGCFGALEAAEAGAQRLAAVIVDGVHRDGAELAQSALPLWSWGTCPAGPLELRRRHATALEAATCGKATVTREDVAFLDEDGIVFVALTELSRVAGVVRDIVARRRDLADRVRAGEPLRDQLGLAAFVERRAAHAEYTFRHHLDDHQRALPGLR